MFTKINTLFPFFEEPNRKFHLRELSKVLGVSPAGARKIASELIKYDLIVESRERNLRLFQANADNKIFKEYKKFVTITRIFESGLISFLNQEFLYPPIILFGSAAMGEDIKKSDIDIFVLANQKISPDLANYEKIINRKIQLFIMNQNEFATLRKNNPELYNNILNGIKLEGFLRVV